MAQPYRVDWQDGLPVLRHGEQSWRLDRYWLKRGFDIQERDDQELLRGLRRCGYADVHVQTIDGEMRLTGNLPDRELSRAQREVPEYDRRTWTAGDQPQVRAQACQILPGGSMEYLELVDCLVEGHPETEVLALRSTLSPDEVIPEDDRRARYYLVSGLEVITATRSILVHGRLWVHRLQTPVIWAEWGGDRVDWQCQILVILNHGRPSPTVEQLHQWTTAEYVMLLGYLNYRRTADGYVMMEEDEEVPPGYPGVGPSHGYRPLRYAESPEWWVGERPPPSGRYAVDLVTPPLTVWTRCRAKSARS